MPYIVLKRNDIPQSTLQVLDLKPNSSQRNYIYDPPGQTKYVNPPQNERLATSGSGPVLSFGDSRGLAAWFLASVNDGTGAASTGTISIAAGNAAPGDTVTIDTTAVGGPAVAFLFVAGAPAASNEVTVGGTNNDSAANLLAAVQLSANGLLPYVTAAAGAANEVDLTAAFDGAAGDSITVATTGANITVPANLAGGVDADALTAAEASTMAQDVLDDLVRFGDNANPAVTADLAAVNGVVSAVVATASLTAEQHAELMSILSGRVFFLPSGVQIADAGGNYAVSPALGSEDGPRFLDPSTRFTYESGALTISFGNGELAGFSASDYEYRGVEGAAVVVYNNDGTLFTV